VKAVWPWSPGDRGTGKSAAGNLRLLVNLGNDLGFQTLTGNVAASAPKAITAPAS
jgi:hypothetical protein